MLVGDLAVSRPGGSVGVETSCEKKVSDLPEFSHLMK
jgi:hypothetical protein